MLAHKTLLAVILLSTVTTLAGANQSANPDPNRFAENIQAFEDWDAKNAVPADPVLFVGSSTIRLWRTHESFAACKKGRDQRVLCPVKQPRWQPMMLSESQPLPIVFRNMRKTRNRPHLEFPESVNLIYPRERSPSSSFWEKLGVMLKAPANSGQQGVCTPVLATKYRHDRPLGMNHLAKLRSTGNIMTLHFGCVFS